MGGLLRALGDAPTTLQALAVMEAHDLVESEAALDTEQANGDFDGIDRIFGSRTRPDTLIGAIQRRTKDVAARQAEADRAERQARADRRAAARQAKATHAVAVDALGAPANADQVTPADTV